MENGGTVNNIGTFALGVVAKKMGVPLDVAAERVTRFSFGLGLSP
jgi:methylthioribose-1-phosphate isomerase